MESTAGVALLVAPAALVSIGVHSSLDSAGVVIARIGGAGLLSLGIACWQARKTPLAPASIGVSWAFLAYNIVTGVTLAWAAATLPGSMVLVLGASILHAAIGAALLAALLGRRRV